MRFPDDMARRTAAKKKCMKTQARGAAEAGRSRRQEDADASCDAMQVVMQAPSEMALSSEYFRTGVTLSVPKCCMIFVPYEM